MKLQYYNHILLHHQFSMLRAVRAGAGEEGEEVVGGLVEQDTIACVVVGGHLKVSAAVRLYLAIEAAAITNITSLHNFLHYTI